MVNVGSAAVSLSILLHRGLETTKQGTVSQTKPALAQQALVLPAYRCYGERVTTKLLLHWYTGELKLGSAKQTLRTEQLERSGTRDYFENMQE